MEASSHHVADANRRGQKRIYLAWVAVFAFNMAVPLLFGLSMINWRGMIGMAVAIVVLMATGCWICATFREFGVSLVIGGMLIGLTQMVPILQFIAGMVGVTIGEVLGVFHMGDEDSPTRINEFGGFIVTLITGTILITMSAASGFLFLRLIPDHWWRRRGKSSEGLTDMSLMFFDPQTVAGWRVGDRARARPGGETLHRSRPPVRRPALRRFWRVCIRRRFRPRDPYVDQLSGP